MGSNQIQKLLHSKRNHEQNEKTIHRMGESIYKWNNWQRINLQDIQIAYAIQYKKKSKYEWNI